MAYALITGAGRGIGRSIAEELASRRKDLLLVSRSEESLKELSTTLAHYRVRIDYLAIDLSSKDAAVRVKEWYEAKGYRVDTLVNNAGYGLWGAFDSLTWTNQYEMLQVNVLTLVELTHLLLPELKKHSKAFILNVASTAAYQAVPTLNLYAAGKSFVLLFSRALRLELKGTTVSVSCVSPGPTTTNFVVRAGMSDEIKHKSEVFGMTPELVAKQAIKDMYKGKAEIIPGWLNKITVLFTTLSPKFVTEKIATELYKK